MQFYQGLANCQSEARTGLVMPGILHLLEALSFTTNRTT
jgi:hypothetical protein